MRSWGWSPCDGISALIRDRRDLVSCPLLCEENKKGLSPQPPSDTLAPWSGTHVSWLGRSWKASLRSALGLGFEEEQELSKEEKVACSSPQAQPWSAARGCTAREGTQRRPVERGAELQGEGPKTKLQSYRPAVQHSEGPAGWYGEWEEQWKTLSGRLESLKIRVNGRHSWRMVWKQLETMGHC